MMTLASGMTMKITQPASGARSARGMRGHRGISGDMTGKGTEHQVSAESGPDLGKPPPKRGFPWWALLGSNQ